MSLFFRYVLRQICSHLKFLLGHYIYSLVIDSEVIIYQGKCPLFKLLCVFCLLFQLRMLLLETSIQFSYSLFTTQHPEGFCQVIPQIKAEFHSVKSYFTQSKAKRHLLLFFAPLAMLKQITEAHLSLRHWGHELIIVKAHINMVKSLFMLMLSLYCKYPF